MKIIFTICLYGIGFKLAVESIGEVATQFYIGDEVFGGCCGIFAEGMHAVKWLLISFEK
jgi:hypothetical protein